MNKTIPDERPFVLYYGGKIAGRFSTSDNALDEVERLSVLDVKHGWLPKNWRIARRLARHDRSPQEERR